MPEIVELAEAFKRHGKHITLETAGTVFKAMPIDLASVSPKLSNSTPVDRDGGRFVQIHEAQRRRPDVVQAFIDQSRQQAADFQLKFVVSDERDLSEIDALLAQLRGWGEVRCAVDARGDDGRFAAREVGLGGPTLQGARVSFRPAVACGVVWKHARDLTAIQPECA